MPIAFSLTQLPITAAGGRVSRTWHDQEGLNVAVVDMTWTANGDYITAGGGGGFVFPSPVGLGFGMSNIFHIYGIEAMQSDQTFRPLVGKWDRKQGGIRLFKGTAGPLVEGTSGADFVVGDIVRFCVFGIGS